MKEFVTGFLALVVGFICGALTFSTFVHDKHVQKTNAERECWYQLGYLEGRQREVEKTAAWQDWQKNLEQFEKTGTFTINGKCYKEADGKIVGCK